MQAMSVMPQPHVLQMLRHKRQAGEEGETETNSQAPPLNYDEGPHPLISGRENYSISDYSQNLYCHIFFKLSFSIKTSTIFVKWNSDMAKLSSIDNYHSDH
jgi:hypothetical protein